MLGGQRNEGGMAMAELALLFEVAQHFQVPVSVVRGLRNKRQGWGEIAVRLAIAQQLSTIHRITYPTVSLALKRIEDLRNEGKKLSQVAGELGVTPWPELELVIA